MVRAVQYYFHNIYNFSPRAVYNYIVGTQDLFHFQAFPLIYQKNISNKSLVGFRSTGHLYVKNIRKLFFLFSIFFKVLSKKRKTHFG